MRMNTIHGGQNVSEYILMNFLSEQHMFYIVDNLKSMDVIFGTPGLRKIGAKIDMDNLKITYMKKKKEEVKPVNYIINEEIGKDYNLATQRIIRQNEIREKVPYNTNVLATIRTVDNEPVWTKQYPYPMSSADFVNKEVEKLLKDGIIRRSWSPYNAPIWIVAKKGTNEDGTPKQRLVIDYKKLNDKTIFDRYPIPDINMILSNLGKSNYFSTIDLEAGYHQIKMKEEDKQKTAFAVNGAKYEFNRMPFGLKNAPSIFQRALDDILRPYIGKFAHVYIDDVLVFSKTKEEHIKHIDIIMGTLKRANMGISNEKSKFFMRETEYLGHVIKGGKIIVDPKKVETMSKYPLPETLKQLRSFLGLTGYYRKFIKNYATLVKPLTTYLREQDGIVSARKSAKVIVKLDEAAKEAFENVKQKLKENVELFQPDYSKPFELTTDASNYAVGAVLSQQRKPIIFISRTLSQTEQNYATNEKETLAIVWALQHLRNYIYGIADLTIFTDHQPLIYAISERNPNLKIKRWKNIIEESGAKLVYQPGKENLVADALSRQYCAMMEAAEEEPQADVEMESIHSRNSNMVEEIPRTYEPLNAFKTQITFAPSIENDISHITTFPGHIRFTIQHTNVDSAINQMRNIVNPRTINALNLPLEHENEWGRKIKDMYPNCKFVIARIINRDITDQNEQIFLINTEHNRAHRGPKENYAQMKSKYFWPNMKKDIITKCKTCDICKQQKYERHPIRQEMNKIPIPTNVGDMLHIDIFHLEQQRFLTVVDKFSKFLQIFRIRQTTEIPNMLEQILILYPNCKNITTDNDALLTSQIARNIFERYDIHHHTTPPAHSITNGQIERAHSTLLEIARSLAANTEETPVEVVYQATREYNKTIHSVTKQKPVDVQYHSDKYPQIIELLKKAQKQMREFENKNRENKEYREGDVIFVKTDRRNKAGPRYKKYTVKENKKETIITTNNREIHKDNIRK